MLLALFKKFSILNELYICVFVFLFVKIIIWEK